MIRPQERKVIVADGRVVGIEIDGQFRQIPAVVLIRGLVRGSRAGANSGRNRDGGDERRDRRHFASLLGEMVGVRLLTCGLA